MVDGVVRGAKSNLLLRGWDSGVLKPCSLVERCSLM